MSAVLTAAEHRAAYLATVQPPLLRYFDLIAQSEGGVARLRELILTLAVQGKLVPQDPADEPASVLLERIRAEKARLMKEGKVRKEKLLPPIAEEEKPFELPAGWEWVRLGTATAKITDGTHHSPPNTPSGEFKYISAKNIKPWGIDLSEVTSVTREVHEEIYARCNPELGDVLYIKDGATTGVVTVNTLAEPFSMLSSVALLKPSCGLRADYLALVMASPVFYQEMRAGMTGVAITRVTLAKLIDATAPLPPLTEQSRIVARVEELMALCDALETRGLLERAQHERLVGTLFEALANSESAHALAENWKRVAAHFDLLLDRPEAVDALEQTILQLAVRGLLVPQDPADEPASALLQKIRTAKDHLIAAGEIKRDKAHRLVNEDENPSEIPAGWATVTIPDLCSIGGGATPSKAKSGYWDGTIPWVSPKDMKVALIDDAQDHVSPLALEETRLPVVPKGSLLVVVRGMILAHSFPVAITRVQVTINQDMKSLTPIEPGLAPYLVLVCLGFRDEILRLVDRSTHGTCKMESEKLFSYQFGLPPLPEQSRIVARVTELRALCANLRQNLAAARQTQSRLTEAMAMVETATA